MVGSSDSTTTQAQTSPGKNKPSPEEEATSKRKKSVQQLQLHGQRLCANTRNSSLRFGADILSATSIEQSIYALRYIYLTIRHISWISDIISPKAENKRGDPHKS